MSQPCSFICVLDLNACQYPPLRQVSEGPPGARLPCGCNSEGMQDAHDRSVKLDKLYFMGCILILCVGLRLCLS